MIVYIIQLLRQICFFLDNIVYSLIEKAFQIIIYLANMNLTALGGITDIINRIYLLLGIFMLFKVSFSFLQYLIDPGSFSDSQKGFGKLLTNTIVALALLVATPFIFKELYEFQGEVIKSNAISNLILGNALTDSASSGTTKVNNSKAAADITGTIAKDVQFAVFGAFYTINYDKDSGLPECDPTKDGNGANANIFGSKDMVNACLDDIVSEMESELNRNGGGQLKDLFKYKSDKDSRGATCTNQICDERVFATLGNLLWWKKGGDDTVFVINYIPLVSTITGGYLLLLLITFCIDVAARAIKLMFLQMVAPISIISYIDPKESISNGKLNGWIKETAKTYFSLFLRLAVIFLAVSLVSILINALFATWNGEGSIYQDDSLKPDPGSGLNIFIFIFLILGVFTFAKQVPQIVENVFGIKMTGEMSLNPFKSIRENMGATALIGGAAGLGASAIAAGSYLGTKGANTVRNIRNLNQEFRAGNLSNEDRWRGIGRTVASTGRGTFGAVTQTAMGALRGARNGVRTGGKGGYFRSGTRAAGQAAWNLREAEESNFIDRTRNAFQEYTLSPTDAYQAKQAAETRKKVKEIVEAMDATAEREVNRVDAGGHHVYNTIEAMNYRAAQERFTQAEEDLKQGRNGVTQEMVNQLRRTRDDARDAFQTNDLTANGTYENQFRDLTALSRSASELPGIDGGAVNSVARAKSFSRASAAAQRELETRRDTLSRADLNADHEQRGRRYWRDNQGR